VTRLHCDRCSAEIEKDPDNLSDSVPCTEEDCSGTMYRLDRPEGLYQISVLGRREAEAYILLSEDHRNLTIAETAEEMDIEENTVKGKLGDIRQKIREAELTARLSL